MQTMLPRMGLDMGCIVALLAKAVGLLGANTHRRAPVALKLVPQIAFTAKAQRTQRFAEIFLSSSYSALFAPLR